MSAAPPPVESDATVVRLRFRADRFNAAMARLGHHTEAQRARAAGIHKRTLLRWRFGRFQGTPASAFQVAAAAGLTVDQLFEPAHPNTLAA